MAGKRSFASNGAAGRFRDILVSIDGAASGKFLAHSLPLDAEQARRNRFYFVAQKVSFSRYPLLPRSPTAAY
jgi:hypothetical protein